MNVAVRSKYVHFFLEFSQNVVSFACLKFAYSLSEVFSMPFMSLCTPSNHQKIVLSFFNPSMPAFLHAPISISEIKNYINVNMPFDRQR